MIKQGLRQNIEKKGAVITMKKKMHVILLAEAVLKRIEKENEAGQED